MTVEEIKALITDEANQCGIRPALALAVAQVESAFNPSARSQVGAMGLFQLMPRIAAYYDCSDAFDVRQNVRAGVRMLADLVRQYEGDTPSVLAAYNWGSGNLASNKPLPTETVNYITRVYGAMGLKPLFPARRWFVDETETPV